MHYMETISIRFEESFLRYMEKIMKGHRYSTKTEFIREAIRDKIDNLETKAALKRLEKVYGFSKRKTTDEELHKAREEAVKEMAQEMGVELG